MFIIPYIESIAIIYMRMGPAILEARDGVETGETWGGILCYGPEIPGPPRAPKALVSPLWGGKRARFRCCGSRFEHRKA